LVGLAMAEIKAERRDVRDVERREAKSSLDSNLKRDEAEVRRDVMKNTQKEKERRAVEAIAKQRRESEQLEKDRREVSTGGGEFRWETVPIAENASQCIFSPESKTIACRGSNGLVECGAALEILAANVSAEVFGLRRHPIKSFVSAIDERVFELYPRKLDNTTYLNYTLIVDDKPVELYLYFGETQTRAGLRVTEKKCFKRLVNVVLSQATAEHEVKVDGTELSVDLFGEVLNAEKPASKRWLGFGFPWMGMGMGMGMGLGMGMGMWGWGLGWGLPFWG